MSSLTTLSTADKTRETAAKHKKTGLSLLPYFVDNLQLQTYVKRPQERQNQNQKQPLHSSKIFKKHFLSISGATRMGRVKCLCFQSPYQPRSQAELTLKITLRTPTSIFQLRSIKNKSAWERGQLSIYDFAGEPHPQMLWFCDKTAKQLIVATRQTAECMKLT